MLKRVQHDKRGVFQRSQYTFKKSETIVKEISQLHQKCKVENFVFYDDAPFTSNTNAKKLFRQIKTLNLPIKFFTPNGINPKYTNKELALLMKELSFIDPRLSLETISDDIHSNIDKKIDLKSFGEGLGNLISEGYKYSEISTYIMAGLPTEDLKDVYRSVETVSKYKVRIRLCELSPAPKSKLNNHLFKCFFE